MKRKKENNIKVICTNTEEDFEKVNLKLTILLAELFKTGKLFENHTPEK